RAYEKTVAMRLRYLERIPLGTSYTEVVERVAEVTRNKQLARRCHLAVDGSGEAGGGSVAEGEAGGDPDAGDDHGRPDGDDGPRVLPGSEAGPDHRATVGLAARGFADRREAAVRAETGGRTGSGGSEDIAGGERAIRGVAGRDARRPGVRGGLGVLERAEGLPERAAGRRPLVDEHSTGRCGEDVQTVEGGGGKAEWPRMNASDENGKKGG